MPPSRPPLVLHLNGLPGVGKSTLARRWADTHPGTLLLDVDALRTWVSGWREDFGGTGARVRPVALAAISAYVGNGGDVVLPQLLADPGEQARFERAAVDAGATYVHVMVEAADDADATARLASRVPDQPWLEAVHALIEDAGPPHLADYAERLARLEPTVRLTTRTGEVDGASSELCAAIGRLHRCPRSPGDGG